MVKHDARARYCIQVGVPREHLRDDIRCEACDELHTLMHLDPTVTEILTREPWCTACQAADSAQGDAKLRGNSGDADATENHANGGDDE